MGRQIDKVTARLLADGIEYMTEHHIPGRYDEVSWTRHNELYDENFYVSERRDIELDALLVESFNDDDEYSYASLMTLDEVLEMIDEQVNDSKPI